MVAVRSQRLAQPGLSGSAPVNARVFLASPRKSGAREKHAQHAWRCRELTKTRYALTHAAAARPHHRSAQARTFAHRLHRHHRVRRRHRAARRLGMARHAAGILRVRSTSISGVVRTAMSRLAADGWLERNKVGRNSFYRLDEKGRQTFDTATRHIYDPPPSDWTGPFRTAADRQWRRPRRLARCAEECGLRQPAAGRMGRALGRAGAGRGRGRDPPGSLRRG